MLYAIGIYHPNNINFMDYVKIELKEDRIVGSDNRYFQSAVVTFDMPKRDVTLFDTANEAQRMIDLLKELDSKGRVKRISEQYGEKGLTPDINKLCVFELKHRKM